MDNSNQTQLPDGATNGQYPTVNNGSFSVPPSAPVPLAPSPVVSSAQGAQLSSPSPVADDSEIDKAWVDQAVAVLDKTRDDPYLQSQEIAKLKAQYMQTRFDKQIKLRQD